METKLDENLYSRQLYVLGTDAMTSFLKSSILIVGMKGLGQEIAKNIILAGIHTVHIHDPNPITINDLGSGFYFSSTSINQRRDHCVLHKMKELNPYVDVSVVDNLDTLNYTTVIFTDHSYKQLINYETRSMLIICQVNGLYSQVFTDFKKFIIKDENGEPCLQGTINDITDGILTVIDEERHQMERNRIKIYKHNCDEVYECFVKAVDHKRVELIDYTGVNFMGGTYEEIKVPKQMEYFSLKDSITKPSILNIDDRAKVIHNCYCLYEQGVDLVSMYKESLSTLPFKVYCEELIRTFEYMYDTEIMPMVSVVGGFVAQEALKSCSGRFTPLNQYFYFDSLECLNWNTQNKEGEINNQPSIENNKEQINASQTEKILNINENNNQTEKIQNINENSKKIELSQNINDNNAVQKNINPIDNNETNNNNDDCNQKTSKGKDVCILNIDYLKEYVIETVKNKDSRYYSYEKIFKQKFDLMKKSCLFIVGAGAIGCEHLKNIVMSGLGVDGKIYLTDMDSIEQSNLNRQFLFRQWDVTKMKSEVAVREARNMNEDYQKQTKSGTDVIESYNIKVDVNTEKIFSDMFYSNLTLVANALDNIDARLYVDSRCVLNCTPLFESGTLGTKGNTQVILPFKTESYASSSDPPEKSIPMCTLRNFPHLIEHTIEFALSEFQNHFNDKIVSIKDFFLKEEHESVKIENIGEDIIDMIISVPKSDDDLLKNSFNLFYKTFYVNIAKLMHSFPVDSKTKEGIPFWSPPKRSPVTVNFDVSNNVHLLFIKSCFFLYAKIFNLDSVIDDDKIISYFNEHKDEILETANEKLKNSDDTQSSKTDIDQILQAHGTYSLIEPIEFEKDDDTNHHIDFIYACANIRAENYKIKEATKLHVKGIAGKIIPAIATTTAMVSGLSVLEMYKYILDCKTEAFRNTYLTLALPMITSSEPLEPLKNELPDDCFGIKEYTIWDKLEYEDMKLNDFIDMFKQKYDLEITMLSCNGTLVFCSFYQQSKYEKNLGKDFRALSGAGEGVKYACLDLLFKDEDKVVPNVVIKLY